MPLNIFFMLGINANAYFQSQIDQIHQLCRKNVSFFKDYGGQKADDKVMKDSDWTSDTNFQSEVFNKLIDPTRQVQYVPMCTD